MATAPAITDGSQYLRKVRLYVVNPTPQSVALDLSQMHIKFEVRQSDLETPNNAVIRIYNLSDNTSQKIGPEYSGVILQAGYQNGNFGQIFRGDIKQVRRGKENPTDTYTEILAADGDSAYTQSIVNTSLAAGHTNQDKINQILLGMAGNGVNSYYAPTVSIGPLTDAIRGKVSYGMARDIARDLAKTLNCSWSIQNGVLTFIPVDGYLPGDAVQLNSKTGMIGMPEQNDNGINIKCLLNPKLKIGYAVQVNNRDIQTAQIKIQYTAINNLPNISNDGFYKMLVVEHTGDTRGNDWYSDMICIAIDPTTGYVKPYEG